MEWILMVILLGFSCLFSIAETSLTTLNKMKLRSAIESGNKTAKYIDKILGKQSKMLTSILAGNNLANVGLSAIATAMAFQIVQDSSGLTVAVTTGITTVAILVIGEITPKTYAAKNAEKVAYVVARPIGAIMVILTPVVFLLGKVTGFFIWILGGNKDDGPQMTETELKTIVDFSHEEGVIQAEEREMINNVFDFGDTTASDVMTPRTDVTAVSVSASYEEIMEVFKEDRFSRLPVYDENIDDIVGVLNLKGLIFSGMSGESFDITKLLQKPYFSYSAKPISKLFAHMRAENIPLAVILDEYGGTMGIVTIEDLVEEIVGEISDEYDLKEDDIVEVRKNEFVVDGGTKIDDFNEEFGTEFKSLEYESIAGYLIGLIGEIPDCGLEIASEGIKFTIKEMDKNRIMKIGVIMERPETVNPSEASEADAPGKNGADSKF